MVVKVEEGGMTAEEVDITPMVVGLDLTGGGTTADEVLGGGTTAELVLGGVTIELVLGAGGTFVGTCEDGAGFAMLSCCYCCCCLCMRCLLKCRMRPMPYSVVLSAQQRER